jgi:hypothetical protein
MNSGPVESKVKYATLGAALAGVAVWSLETYVFRGVVPVPIQALIDIAVPAIAVFGFGYSAHHTWRGDPDAQATAPPNPPL